MHAAPKARVECRFHSAKPRRGGPSFLRRALGVFSQINHGSGDRKAPDLLGGFNERAVLLRRGNLTMISDVFRVLRDALLNYVQLASGFRPSEAARELIVFPGSDKSEAIDIKLGAVTMLLVNLEEDRRALPADPYRRTLADGTTVSVKAAVPLNLYILFVARFSDYLESLRYVGLVAQFFQANRLITRESLPALSGGIEKLMCELITTPITEDNHVWRTLSAPYHPSLLYRVRMVAFQDTLGLPTAEPGAPLVGVNE